MGASCDSCTSAEAEDRNTIILDSNKNYHLEPHNFYNEITKEVASKLGPFKYNDEETRQYITKGPVKLENNTVYIG